MSAADTVALSALLGRVALRDRTAFRALYAAAAPKLFAVLVRILKDRPEAEEALQEVFVKVWTHGHRYDPERGAAQAWLNQVARNHALDMIRARRPDRAALAGDEAADAVAALPDPAPTPEATAVLAGEGRRIDACMAALASERADAVRRAYVEGDSYADLADRYGVPLNTMRSWLRRSLIQLRECLSR